ncbi:MAG: zinc-ribbon domain containing protein [Dehalococcoidia bacterium]|nr:zinc-ribbon domain containing protein [Dehalococcoidia bacterium]MDW8119826.1 zinc-ribbon domain containing protein [Chloroflexota bacterium]
MAYSDRTLTCVECGAPFTFSAGEQEFYASKGYQNEPKRCPTCRAARRVRNGGVSARPSYSTVCARCGQPAQVPFQPRSGRPVYCSDCFSLMRGPSR